MKRTLGLYLCQTLDEYFMMDPTRKKPLNESIEREVAGTPALPRIPNQYEKAEAGKPRPSAFSSFIGPFNSSVIFIYSI